MDRFRNLDLGRVAILLLLVIGTAALLTRNQWDWFFASAEPRTEDVSAEQIAIADVDPVAERLYRVRPDNGSEVSYRVRERLAGNSRMTVGTTTVVAGDI